ncbi:MAG: hypothetical protein QF878_16980 [SAR202 cluster bacterium]|nr:hypothetical protein [SAR202 cluster bacterium]MDP6715277.1 hypothetical protein [SAR202 cluster bacterium]
MSAELCLGRMAHNFHTSRHPSRNIERRAQRVFRRIYSETVPKKEQSKRPLHIIIGHLDPTIGPQLWRFASNNDFRPVSISQQATIRMPTAGEIFKSAVDNEVESWFASGGHPPLRPDEAALTLVSIFYGQIVQPEIDNTVGGPIQVAVIDRNGWNSQTIAAHNGQDGWKLVTPPQDSSELLSVEHLTINAW